MPKFNLDINGENDDVAEGYEPWSGEMPPTGAYIGRMKTCQMAKASEKAKNPGALRIKIGFEVTDGPFKGFFCVGGVNLTEQGTIYINQWLRALTNGSDSEFAEIKKEFYAGFGVDKKEINVTDIGKWKVNSPDGKLPLRVALKQENYNVVVDGISQTRTRVNIDSFLLPVAGMKSGATTTAGPAKPVAEEEAEDIDVDLDDEGSVFDGDDADADMADA